MIIGTAQHFRWLSAIVKWVLVLNLIDAILTLFWVRAGFAREANTLIDELVNEHALVFVLVKLSLVGMGSLLLWRQRHSWLAVVSIFTAFVTYYLVLLYHLEYASALIMHILGG